MDERYAYRTGRTDPAKSSRGLIAGLLICVIFLGGLVSALGIMNIHLFRQLGHGRSAPLSFAEGEATQVADDSLELVGMALQEADPVYQELHDLPQGLFVTRVEPGSQAEKLGICPGDVLTALDKTPVTTLDGVKELLSEKDYQLLLWRNGEEISLTVSQ